MDVDFGIRELAARQYGALARSQLAALGLTRSAIRHRVRSGMLDQRSRRCFVLAGTPALAAQAGLVAVLDAPTGSMLSHRSAAAWWGLPGFDLNGKIEIVIPRQGAPRNTPISRWHYQHPIPMKCRRVLRGIPVTSPALTLLHLGSISHSARVARAVNNALAARVATVDELWSVRRHLSGSGRDGVGVLAGILEQMGPDYVPTDSGAEMRLSQLAAGCGVGLERQIWVGDNDDWIGRADFRLVADPDGLVELSSFRYHSMFLDRLEDQRRFRRMHRAGFTVLQVWDTDLWNRPDEVVEALIRFSMDLAARRIARTRSEVT